MDKREIGVGVPFTHTKTPSSDSPLFTGAVPITPTRRSLETRGRSLKDTDDSVVNGVSCMLTVASHVSQLHTAVVSLFVVVVACLSLLFSSLCTVLDDVTPHGPDS